MGEIVPRNGSSATLLNWMLGIVGSLIVAGIVSLMVITGTVRDRLADLEATIRENKSERERRDASLEMRMSRLEEDVRELQRSRGR